MRILCLVREMCVTTRQLISLTLLSPLYMHSGGALLTWIATSVTDVAAEEEVIWLGTGGLGISERIDAQYSNCRLGMHGAGWHCCRPKTLANFLVDTTHSSIHQEAKYTL